VAVLHDGVYLNIAYLLRLNVYKQDRERRNVINNFQKINNNAVHLFYKKEIRNPKVMKNSWENGLAHKNIF
jgi:hypothetical protein